jgi:NADH:ubiquinone oxidoreductase subunit E
MSEEDRAMKVTVCIGSSCHLKGARQVVEELQYLIASNNIKDKVELAGTFCMSNCQNGVCVTLEDKVFSLTPDTTKDFFQKEILAIV